MHVTFDLYKGGHTSTNASRLSIACTKMQETCMWACRAVARPDADC